MPRAAAERAPSAIGAKQAHGWACGICVSMASLARPAALAALALALVPVAARADTSNIVFPVAGPVVRWHDDYGTTFKGVRQLGNAIGVAPGTPVVAAAAGRGAHALARQRRLEPHADDGRAATTSSTCTSGRDGNRKTAYLPGLKDGAKVAAAQRLGFSGCSGAPHVRDAAARLPVPAGRRRARRPLRGARERTPAAGGHAHRSGRARQAAHDGVLTWSVRGDKASLAAPAHREHRARRPDARGPSSR